MNKNKKNPPSSATEMQQPLSLTSLEKLEKQESWKQ